MSGTTRVLVALSGGVDSSVAALLLREAGHEVIGVFLRNGVEAPPGSCRPRQGCCSAEDARDAARVAHRLDIPFHSLDLEREFAGIQADFAAEYAAGRTPNPCVLCNRDIKFGALLRFAAAMGAERVATGHYARLDREAGRPILRRGADPAKDQSYVLFPVGEAALARVLLPVGELCKERTRALAREAGLPVADKPDSQEICFVPTGDYRDFLRLRGGLGRPGRFLDLQGRVLGRHQGHMGFTRGQRRGLGIAAGEPLYVIHVDARSGDVVVGSREATLAAGARVEGWGWIGPAPPLGAVLEGVEIQYRSTPGGVPGRVRVLAATAVAVEFTPPAASVTPGQGLAVYQGDCLLGGGWIHSAEPVVPPETHPAVAELLRT